MGPRWAWAAAYTSLTPSEDTVAISNTSRDETRQLRGLSQERRVGGRLAKLLFRDRIDRFHQGRRRNVDQTGVGTVQFND
jgi:hypothetical protein